QTQQGECRGLRHFGAGIGFEAPSFVAAWTGRGRLRTDPGCIEVIQRQAPCQERETALGNGTAALTLLIDLECKVPCRVLHAVDVDAVHVVVVTTADRLQTYL